jgi:hypothetical protein
MSVMTEVVRAPDLVEELSARASRAGSLRIQVRAAYPPWALDPGLRAAVAALRELGIGRAEWRQAGHVGEVVVETGSVAVEAVVSAVDRRSSPASDRHGR